MGILDFDDQDDNLPEDQQPLVETAAQMLYGLIHARFIMTTKGMAVMLDKYNASVYGTCPMLQCDALHQPVLPIGTSDLLRQGVTKVYCPHCKEIYHPKSSRLECLDGAYFGTSFAHLFFMTYQHLVPQSIPQPCVPRLYGFKIHKIPKGQLQKSLTQQASGSQPAIVHQEVAHGLTQQASGSQPANVHQEVAHAPQEEDQEMAQALIQPTQEPHA